MNVGRAAGVAISLSFLLGSIRPALAVQTNVELIIDDSGSMARKIEGGRKIEVAKQVLSGLVQDLPSDALIAVRTYGRTKPSSARDCGDMELMTPFGPNTTDRVLPGVKALKPNGMTPIAASLEAAAKDFAGKEGQNNIIVLLSDGEEDCNGDPCAAAKSVHEAGIHLQVNVIGLHVKPNERTQLQCVADAGGGKYYDAANAGELKVAASEVKERIAAAPTPYAKKGEPLYGDPIRGGDSYETAVALAPDKLFHLDHDQPGKHFDFFSVAAKGGQEIVVTAATGPNGRYSGVVIADATHQDLDHADVIGARDKSAARHELADGQDATFFILIGSRYEVQNQDATFRVDLIDHYDANSDRDAGSEPSRALEVAPGTYMHNYMSGTDQVDMFKFKADPGTGYAFKARPSDPKASLQLQATDSDGVSLAEGQSSNPGAAAKLENLRLPKSGYVYVKVTYAQFGPKGEYSFALGKGDVDSPPPPPGP